MSPVGILNSNKSLTRTHTQHGLSPVESRPDVNCGAALKVVETSDLNST